MALSKRTKRILWIVAGIVVVVPIVVVLVILLRLGTFIKLDFEQVGPRVLGVETRLDDVTVYILKGQVSISGMEIGNPEGFTSPTFLKVDLVRVHANVGALLKNEIHVREVILEGPEFTYELKGKQSNLSALMERLDSGEEKPEASTEPEGKASEIKLKIDLIRVTDAKLRVVIMGNPLEVDLPSIEIRDVADADGNAVPPDQVAKVFLRSVGAQITEVVKASEVAKQVQEMTDELQKKITEETGLDVDVGAGVKEAGGMMKKAGGAVKKLFGK